MIVGLREWIICGFTNAAHAKTVLHVEQKDEENESGEMLPAKTAMIHPAGHAEPRSEKA
jgi:hypothetical protein